MLDRAFILLETKNWKKADLLFDRILDREPRAPIAYLGKCMANLHIKNVELIPTYGKKVLKNVNFQLSLRFASGIEKERLQKIENDAEKSITRHKMKLIDVRKKALKISIILITLSLTVTGSIFGYDKIISPFIQYNQAQRLLDEKKYDSALKKYKKLKTYKNSEEKLSETLYEQANYFLEKQQFERAIENFEMIGNYKDSEDLCTESLYEYAKLLYSEKEFVRCSDCFLKIKNYKDSNSYLQKPEIFWRTKGNIVKFGKYEQDDNLYNGKEEIEWIVLEPNKSNDTVLLISRLCLDYKKYDDGNYGLDSDGNYDMRADKGIDWENCSLRAWLNDSFYEDAFTPSEKSKLNPILLTYYIYEHKTSNDNVSILSKDEAKMYFDETVQMSAGETKFAYQNLSKTYHNNKPRSKYSEERIVDYWLKSLGKKVLQDIIIADSNVANATTTNDKGVINKDGAMYMSPIIAVRPIIIVSID